MKWAVRSVFGLVIGACVALVVLVSSLDGFFTRGASRRSSATGSRDAAGTPRTGDATDSLVADMYVQNSLERDRVVAEIREEFGIEVNADRFSSHHTARDYLAHLHLAREAKELGLDVDPEAFGDDEFMRRHIQSLRQGRATAAAGTAPTIVDPQRAAGPVPSGQDAAGSHARDAATAAALVNAGDYIFIYGHRYYPDGRGAYVRTDGTVLNVSTAKGTCPAAPAGRPADKPIDAPILGTDLLGDLDRLLDLLGTRPVDSR